MNSPARAVGSRPMARRVACSATQFQGAAELPPAARPRVVGMGSAGVDYLAAVAAFPRPDEKLRTTRLEVQGGGNAGNALVAAARLGAAPALVSKVGADALGDGIAAEFGAEGVDTGALLRGQPGSPSPFTYIIVDAAGGTRTCIHTPGEPFVPEELTPELAARALAGAAVAYFDGRLTEAAAELAAAARAARVPVLVEAERLRPGLDALLAHADFVVTSQNFPAEWTGEASVGDALAAVLARLPRARWVLTTLGARGSVLLERPPPGGAAAAGDAPPAALDDVLETLFAEAAGASGGGGAPACVTDGGVAIAAGGLASAPAPLRLRPRRGDAPPPDGVRAAADAAAARAAAANADAPDAAARYAAAAGAGGAPPPGAPVATVTVAEAARLPRPADVVDTTGAGDAFIGSLLYALARGRPPAAAMRLGAVVAAAKCTALGARPGLPRRRNLAPGLL